MSKTTKWIIGIVVAILVLQFAMPFVWQLFFPGAYGGYGMHMPMMGFGFGFGFFGMLLMWLFPIGILILIVLGIAWLVGQLTTNKGGDRS
ncbi:hypothetical protein FBQ81_19160 [Chloroflexi bacterium CFX6]|nr:hypothetical protein [Chloroflexi bacterium CFX6]